MSDQVLHPCKTTGKFVVLYILIFTFLESQLEDKGFCTAWWDALKENNNSAFLEQFVWAVYISTDIDYVIHVGYNMQVFELPPYLWLLTYVNVSCICYKCVDEAVVSSSNGSYLSSSFRELNIIK